MSGLRYRDPIRAINTEGVVYSGARLSLYESDGVTRALICADASLTTPLSNPLEADAAGRFQPLYVAAGGATYRVVVATDAGVTVVDEVITPAILPIAISDDQPKDDNGAPLPLATRAFYAAQTNEPLAIFGDEALTEEIDNPAVADVDGNFGPIFVNVDLAYRTILNDGNGCLIYDVGRFLLDPAGVQPTVPLLSGVLNGGSTAINYSWTAATSQFSTIAGYRLFDAATDTLIVDQPGLAFSLTPVSSGNSYTAYVIAYDADGLVSARSNIVSISINASVFPVASWINPGAELTDMSGWTVTLGNFCAIGPTDPTSRSPPEGAWVFNGGPSSAESRAYQRIDLIAIGVPAIEIDELNTKILCEWWGGQFIQTNPDQPELNFYFRDASLALVGSYSSGLKNPVTVSGVYRWTQYHETTPIPFGTRYIDVEMHAHRRAGTYNDGSFDYILPVVELITP